MTNTLNLFYSCKRKWYVSLLFLPLSLILSPYFKSEIFYPSTPSLNIKHHALCSTVLINYYLLLSLHFFDSTLNITII